MIRLATKTYGNRNKNRASATNCLSTIKKETKNAPQQQQPLIQHLVYLIYYTGNAVPY